MQTAPQGDASAWIDGNEADGALKHFRVWYHCSLLGIQECTVVLLPVQLTLTFLPLLQLGGQGEAIEQEERHYIYVLYPLTLKMICYIDFSWNSVDLYGIGRFGKYLHVNCLQNLCSSTFQAMYIYIS